jgi:hypothetical protein
VLPLDWLIDLLFGTLYGGVVTVIALLAAIPYGIWQGMKRLWAMRPGRRSDGHAGTGR